MSNQTLRQTVLLRCPADLFEKIVQPVSKFCEELCFRFTSDGLFFRSMDPNHVVLVDIYTPPLVFDSYECKEASKITLRSDDLLKVLKRAGAKDVLTLKVVKDEMVELLFEGAYPRNFNLHLLESPSSDLMPLPKLSPNAKVTLSLEVLKKVAGDHGIFGDHIRISSTRDHVSFRTKGSNGEANRRIDKSSIIPLELDVKEESTASYSIPYLSDFLSTVTCEKLSLEYSSKMPLIVKAPLTEKDGLIHCYIAPRVEEL